MAWFSWLQSVGGDESWTPFLAEEKERLVRDRKPAFTTILDADNDFKSEMSAEDLAKVHYRGPFYVDFDSSSLEEVIPQFKKFLRKLKEDYEFCLDQAHIYATGGKGFHVIVPSQCFISKNPPKGLPYLPAIYKEMAMDLYVDTLDLRVYTARRGRMFRTANVERPDKPGVWKVPLSVHEALDITPEQYKSLTTGGPRHLPPPAPPEFNANLGLLFASSHDKVDKAMKNRKSSKADEKLLRKFGGEFPESIVAVMTGETIAEGVGFQKIATQLALAAHALGKSEDTFIEMCSGLCENHQSDGVRYNTVAKRRNELRRMYQYMHANPCYQFSVGGVKSLMPKDFKTPDLDSGGVAIEEEEEDQEEFLDYSLTQGVRVTTTGIFKKTEEGPVKLCEIGLSNPKQLVDIHSEKVIGYEVQTHMYGKHLSQQVITMDTFLSRQKFCAFTLAVGGANMSGTDAQVGGIADILRTRAMKNDGKVYVTGREGLDIVTLPDGSHDVVWADIDGVTSRVGNSYRLVGIFTSEPEFKTDLRRSPRVSNPSNANTGDILADDEAIEYFERLFAINSPNVLGRLFGWYFATYFCQALRHLFNQFPMLQVFGPAGSGKTQTNLLLSHMFYWHRRPLLTSAIGATPFTLECLMSGSASLPVLIDEVKPREMRKDRLDRLKMLLRGNYAGEDISKGRVSAETGQSKLDIRRGINGAPLVFIGEAIESQSAILERCVMVSMDKVSKRGHAIDFKHCQANYEMLSALGRVCLDKAMGLNLKALRKLVLEKYEIVAKAVGEAADDADRPIFNMAVVLLGLDFGRKVMSEIFGEHFDTTFDRMQDAILGNSSHLIPRVMSEASKVLDTLAYLSRVDHEEANRLQMGQDYVIAGEHLELRLKTCYTKYVRFKRSLGEEVLYDSAEVFVNSMQTYAGVRDTVCLDSLLKDDITTVVFAYSLEHLADEGVSNFNKN